jgi:hypothetical protein
MQRPWLKTAAAALVVTAIFAGLSTRAESPFVSNWKVVDVSNGNEAALVLLKIEEKDGKFQAKALASPLLRDSASIENLKVDATSMEFDIKCDIGVIHAKAYIDPKKKGIRGVLLFNTRVMIAQFVKTDDTEMTDDTARSDTAEGELLEKAKQVEAAKEKQSSLKTIVEKHANKPAGFLAAEALLNSYTNDGGTDEEIRATAAKVVALAAAYGPEVEKNAMGTACQTLARAEKVSPGALEFIQQCEKGLTKNDPPQSSVKVLHGLATALKKSGKDAEAAQLEPRIEKIEEVLDADFEKTAVPFTPEEFKGRKGSSKRVAVVELFTGAYCPPCVAADVAFDAALKTYKPADVVLLQYHVHIPAPDRLTNSDTEKRQKYYSINGVPSPFVNGAMVEGLGGPKSEGKTSYDALRNAVDDVLEKDPPATMSLKAERKGDKIDIAGEVRELTTKGENIRLRFVLVEDVARYPGGNGQRLHQHVVRALPGGADGFALTEVETRKNVTVDLADLKKTLDTYMTDFNKGNRKFRDDEYPLSLKNLKVVALIQDDKSKEILQAAQIDVPAAK